MNTFIAADMFYFLSEKKIYYCYIYMITCVHSTLKAPRRSVIAEESYLLALPISFSGSFFGGNNQSISSKISILPQLNHCKVQLNLSKLVC